MRHPLGCGHPTSTVANDEDQDEKAKVHRFLGSQDSGGGLLEFSSLSSRSSSFRRASPAGKDFGGNSLGNRRRGFRVALGTKWFRQLGGTDQSWGEGKMPLHLRSGAGGCER